MTPHPVLDLGASSQPYAVLLWVLFALFVLRVLGQILVATDAVRWLPAMREWYSGLIPYPVLLPIQLLFIAVMVWMTLTVAGAPARPALVEDAWGRTLAWLSILYAGTMAARWIRWLRTPPERRRAWIPIIFHVALAAFLLVYASWLQRG